MSAVATQPSTPHIIDCDADPFIPKGWKVEEHKKGGQFIFSPSNIELYLDEKQKDGIFGDPLHKRLTNKPVLNANALDYLLANTDLIPEGWKTEDPDTTAGVFFWGTVYCDEHGDRCVRFLIWQNGQWRWDFNWFDLIWESNDPAVIRKN